MGNILIIENMSEEHLELLMGNATFINSGSYIVIPEEEYKHIPKAIKKAYKITLVTLG